MEREAFGGVAEVLNATERRLLLWLIDTKCKAIADRDHEVELFGQTKSTGASTVLTYRKAELTDAFDGLWARLNITPRGERVAALIASEAAA